MLWTDGQDDDLGEIIVEYHGATVISAPRRAMVTLDLVHALDHRHKVHGDRIQFGPLNYRVTGWSTDHSALIVERIDA